MQPNASPVSQTQSCRPVHSTPTILLSRAFSTSAVLISRGGQYSLQLNFTAPRMRFSAHGKAARNIKSWGAEGLLLLLGAQGKGKDVAFASSWGCPSLELELSLVYLSPSQAATQAEGSLAQPEENSREKSTLPMCFTRA